MSIFHFQRFNYAFEIWSSDTILFSLNIFNVIYFMLKLQFKILAFKSLILKFKMFPNMLSHFWLIINENRSFLCRNWCFCLKCIPIQKNRFHYMHENTTYTWDICKIDFWLVIQIMNSSFHQHDKEFFIRILLGICPSLYVEASPGNHTSIYWVGVISMTSYQSFDLILTLLKSCNFVSYLLCAPQVNGQTLGD